MCWSFRLLAKDCLRERLRCIDLRFFSSSSCQCDVTTKWNRYGCSGPLLLRFCEIDKEAVFLTIHFNMFRHRRIFWYNRIDFFFHSPPSSALIGSNRFDGICNSAHIWVFQSHGQWQKTQDFILCFSHGILSTVLLPWLSHILGPHAGQHFFCNAHIWVFNALFCNFVL